MVFLVQLENFSLDEHCKFLYFHSICVLLEGHNNFLCKVPFVYVSVNSTSPFSHIMI